MAGKDHTYEIKDKWCDLDDYSTFGKVPKNEVLSIVSARPVHINLTVVVPAELISGKPPKFDIDRCAPVRRVWEAINRMLIETLESVAMDRRSDSGGNADAYSEADKKLKALNDFMKKSFKQLRPLIRDAVAKTLGGAAKADDLQTIGSIDFREFEIKPGTFANEVEVEPPLLDLTKAFKNRRPQECGLAWNGKTGVISVKRRKEFKPTELKELREQLPKNKSVGASMLACRFTAETSSRVLLEIAEKDTPPDVRVVARAIKKQSQRVVTVTFKIREDEPEEEDEEEEGQDKKKKAKGKKGAKGKSKKK